MYDARKTRLLYSPAKYDPNKIKFTVQFRQVWSLSNYVLYSLVKSDPIKNGLSYCSAKSEHSQTRLLYGSSKSDASQARLLYIPAKSDPIQTRF